MHEASEDVEHSVEEAGNDFGKLYRIVKRLRGRRGCAWDRQQTPSSMRKNLVEEAYECVDAIEQHNAENLKEELGDLLFHILFLSRIAEERGEFDIWGVIDRISEKMVSRHPHVFGEKKVSSSREVKKQPLGWRDCRRWDGPQHKSLQFQ